MSLSIEQAGKFFCLSENLFPWSGVIMRFENNLLIKPKNRCEKRVIAANGLIHSPSYQQWNYQP